MKQTLLNPKNLIEEVNLSADDDLAIPECVEDVYLLDDIQFDSAPTTNSPHQGAYCIAMMGAVGGVGVTSLCIQLAHNLAIESQKKMQRMSRTKEPRVCLIDLDFDSGSCAHQLDLTPNLSMTDLMQPADRIDRAYATSLISTHSSGIDLLASPNTLGGNDMANPIVVTTLLDIMCQMYDHVIIDVPRYWRPWNMAAIGGADKFAIVTDLTIPSLHLARMRMESIEKQFEGQVHSEILLNKYERRSFRNALREKDAEVALKRDIAGTICIDTDTLREAINCGEAAGTIRPESRYVKDVRNVQKMRLKQEETESRAVA